MQIAPDMESSPRGDGKAERTAFIAVVAGVPGLALTAIASASSTSLAIRADLLLTLLDMLVMVTVWLVGIRGGRTSAGPASRQMQLATVETLASVLAALCMSVSMAVVAWSAIGRIMAGGMAPQGSGVVLGMATNFGYAVINLWILRRWQRRGRSVSSALIRSQICLFSDKLTSNMLIGLSLAAALALEGTTIARFIDPVAGLLIASATACWTVSVIRNAFRGLQAYRLNAALLSNRNC